MINFIDLGSAIFVLHVFKSRSNTYAAPCSIHADDNPENFDYIKYYHNLFVPVFFDDFVKWLQQQKKHRM